MQRRTAAGGNATREGEAASAGGSGGGGKDRHLARFERATPDQTAFAARPRQSSWFNTTALVQVSVVVVLIGLAYKLNAGKKADPLHPGAHLQTVFASTTPLFGDIEFAEHPNLGKCILVNGRIKHCEHDQAALHESLVHPPMLLHPFPRRVLISGGSDGAHVREALKHFLLNKIVVVGFDKYLAFFCREHFGGAYRFDDVLSRAEFHPENLSDYLRSRPGGKFDVILVDFDSGSNSAERFSAQLLKLLKSRLSDGGIIGVRTGSLHEGNGALWFAHREIGRQFRHVHLYSAFVQSISQLVGFHVMYDSGGIVDPRNLSPDYVELTRDRRTTEKLEHYDGHTHLSMFNLPSWLRNLLARHTDEEAAASWSGALKSYAPYSHASIDWLSDPVLRGSTVQREFFGCETDVLSRPERLRKAVVEAAGRAHATVVSVATENSDAHVNLTNHGPDLVRRLAANRPGEDRQGRSSDPAAATEVIAYAALSSGHVAVHAFPQHRYAVATFVNFNFEAVPDEFFRALFELVRAARSVGSSLRVGPPRYPATAAAPQTSPALDHFYIPARRSAQFTPLGNLTMDDGLKQYARDFIPKGTVLFQRPVDPNLIHNREVDVNRAPTWLSSYVSGISDDAEKNIFLMRDSHDKDFSHINHNCDPNVVYDGYDAMMARRDIRAGEELSYDHATVGNGRKAVFQCNCGSPLCRGRVTAEDWKDDRLVERLGIKSFWPHVQKKIILAHRRKGNT